MFKALFTLIKLGIFVVVILVAAQLVRVQGRTVSDQVRVGLSSASRSEVVNQVKDWTGNLVTDVKEGTRRKLQKPLPSDTSEESIAPTERQKLKALIRELNGSR